MDDYFKLAVDNITQYGDTDIFPFPIENHIFYDNKEQTVELLNDINKDFTTFLEKYPPVNISTCVPLGYTGFRWATQIDPIWNAYYLGLVLSIAPNFEAQRIPKEENVVYSYRFNPSKSGSLFDKDFNWMQFQKKSLELAKEKEGRTVLSCDIANFYHRISHHNLRNAMDRLGLNNDVPYKIDNIVQKFSEAVSCGLPIGGPASRILAELALNNIDQHLKLHSIRFCRFVDDFNIFVGSESEALSVLNMLTKHLMKNEVLSLQQNKTQIYSSDEFCNVIEKRLTFNDSEAVSKSKVGFMSLNLHFDPYSETAVEEYEAMKESIKKYDVMGLLI
ncbi:MAG: RNA-directed DNA polymerase, partial [Phycisphaerae bacterium]